MSSIGGPGGIGGPNGPGGPDGPGDIGGPEDVGDVSDVGDVGDVGQTAAAAPTGDVDAIAADLAAGKLTPHEAVDRLVEQIAGGADLPAADRAELRELMADLVANDPHLGQLIGRI